MDSFKKRRTVRENIATPAQPVWRYRVMTPLTPRLVRESVFAPEPGLSDERALARRRTRVRHALRQLTVLDEMLTADEADVLERWVAAEGHLAGHISGAAYAGDRVSGSGAAGVMLIPDRVMAFVNRHQAYKQYLDERERAALGVFVEQMSGSAEAPTEAQAGLRFCPARARDKRRAWASLLASIAKRLVVAGY